MTDPASVLASLHYKRHRYPAEIIARAVWLRVTFFRVFD